MWPFLILFPFPLLLSIFRILCQEGSTHNYNIDYTNRLYNQNETKALKELRIRMGQGVISGDKIYANDSILILWLRAQNMDVNLTSKKLEEVFKWRAENNLDKILNENHFEHLPGICWVDGVDMFGGPVIYVKGDGVDIRKILLSGLETNLTRRMYQCIESTIEKTNRLSRKSGAVINQATVIADASVFNVKQHGCIACLTYYIQMISRLETYFPDIFKLVVLVNGSRAFKPLFDILMPMISPSRSKVVKLFGVDKKQWMSYLLSIIPENELPQDFGGNGTRIHKLEKYA